VPIIEPVQRGNWIPLDPAERQRFGQRSAASESNGRLKDFFGGRTVRVRGATKVMCHLMFGILAITALSICSGSLEESGGCRITRPNRGVAQVVCTGTVKNDPGTGRGSWPTPKPDAIP